MPARVKAQVLPTRRSIAPVRTCVGCRRKAPQHELVRLARLPEGSVAVDRTAPGRGAWLCSGSVDCLQLATKKRALERAFRLPVNATAMQVLQRSFGQNRPDVADLYAAGSSGGQERKG